MFICREHETDKQIAELRQESTKARDENEMLVSTNDPIRQIQAIMLKEIGNLEENLRKKEQEAKSAEEKAANLQVKLDQQMSEKEELVGNK